MPIGESPSADEFSGVWSGTEVFADIHLQSPPGISQ
jgi:hypothetical protein